MICKLCIPVMTHDSGFASDSRDCSESYTHLPQASPFSSEQNSNDIIGVLTKLLKNFTYQQLISLLTSHYSESYILSSLPSNPTLSSINSTASSSFFLRTGCQDREYSFAEVFFLLFFLLFDKKVCFLRWIFFSNIRVKKSNGT